MTAPQTPRQAFKFGFLLKCAELGLDQAERIALVEAALATVREKTAAGPVSSALGLLKGLGGWGLAAGAAGGATLGYLGAKATEPAVDPEEFKQWELIAALRQQADRARSSAAQHQMRAQALAPRAPKLLSQGAA